jgi:hypothetical protein
MRHLALLLLASACAPKPAPPPPPAPGPPTWQASALPAGLPLALAVDAAGAPIVALRDGEGCLVLAWPDHQEQHCDLPGPPTQVAVDPAGFTAAGSEPSPWVRTADGLDHLVRPPACAPEPSACEARVLALTRYGADTWLGGLHQPDPDRPDLHPWLVRHDGAGLPMLTAGPAEATQSAVTSLLATEHGAWAAGSALTADHGSTLWLDRLDDQAPALTLPGRHPTDAPPVLHLTTTRTRLYVSDADDRAVIWQHQVEDGTLTSQRLQLPAPRLRTTPLTVVARGDQLALAVLVQATEPTLLVLTLDAEGHPIGEAAAHPLGLDFQPMLVAADLEGGWFIAGRRLDRRGRYPELRHIAVSLTDREPHAP